MPRHHTAGHSLERSGGVPAGAKWPARRVGVCVDRAVPDRAPEQMVETTRASCYPDWCRYLCLRGVRDRCYRAATEAEDEETAYPVTVITLFGVIATLPCPYLAHGLFPADLVAGGRFLGTAIHDTAQVTGAAMIYSDVFSLPRALEVAAVTKLVRNVLMAAVIPYVAFRYVCSRSSADASSNIGATVRKYLPLFVLGFLICAALRSVGDAGIRAGGTAFGVWGDMAWQGVHSFIKQRAADLLVVALAGVGLVTRSKSLRTIRVKPFAVGLDTRGGMHNLVLATRQWCPG